MSNQTFVSASEYAAKHKISKMQVTRLIKAGKLFAQKVGQSWMIPIDPNNINQIGFEKYTSIQKWNKLIQSKLNRKLKIEDSKDRELIYARLQSLGLPHERCFAFPCGDFPSLEQFKIAVGRIGFPYWISAVPDPQFSQLNRQSKLRIYDVKTGWEFISKLADEKNYKIIISQYPDDPDFKGTVVVARSGNGIAEFVTGDRHYIMTRGFTLTDPMLFNQQGIKRFSKTVPPGKQKKLFNLVRGIYGHLEFQHGLVERKRFITFLDYNEEAGYLEIDKIWRDLVLYFVQKRKKEKKKLYGLPASPGKTFGRCFVVHHETVGLFEKIQSGDILVADTTTPEMTSMLGKASAIVTDLGGVLSHAAIVCRELKIPAVVGVTNATERLRSGDLVRVDADRGVIEIVDSG